MFSTSALQTWLFKLGHRVHSSLFLRFNTRDILMLYRRPGSLTESKCWTDRLAKVAGSDPRGTLSEEREGRTQSEMYGCLDHGGEGGDEGKKIYSS